MVTSMIPSFLTFRDCGIGRARSFTGLFDFTLASCLSPLDSRNTLPHSRWWRNPAAYANKSVLVIGYRASGRDIVAQLAEFDETSAEHQHDGANGAPQKIYHSIRNLQEKIEAGETIWSEDQTFSKRIHLVPELEKVEAHALRFIDGTVLEGIDVIIFATGYLYK